MSKRPRVPAALHSELSEYSSLLRALRTSNALDLASQLTLPEPGSIEHEQDDLSDDDEGETEIAPSEPSTHDAFSRASSMFVRTPKRQRANAKRKRRDTWTRWPLMAGDVHVPEWGLEDEIKHLALRLLKGDRPDDPARSRLSSLGMELDGSVQGVSDADSPATAGDEDEDEHLLPPSSLSALTATSSAYLSQILALLAAHVPVAEKSLQNRVKPINWETVLDVAGASDLIDANVALGVRRRMEQMYGSSRSHAAERVEATCAVQNRFAEALSSHKLSYLTQFGVQPMNSGPKRKRGPYKKRKTDHSPETVGPSQIPSTADQG
ncbi:hypothetical protein OBBRIDRAFT_99347 [Obba rivulosa]|uniref:Uncharacterized protein n=1 Tax=Obba rivulosa TaxID=1052685 RepID=A0A8E2J4S3_9APHY|nr:hypothetical protein OBBRIDRAFT_99347 [Obba rivulosa]